MTRRIIQPDDESEFRLPDQLADDLTSLYGQSPTIPDSIDDAILTRARRRFTGYRRSRLMLRRVAEALAAAAAIAMVVLTWSTFTKKAGESEWPAGSAMAMNATEDIDRNGQVDILDAFGLARHIEDGVQLDARWDINGDGNIDRGDVDAVARAAVSLKGGTS